MKSPVMKDKCCTLVRNVYATTVSTELHLFYTAQYCSTSFQKCNLHEAFQFIIEDQHQGTASTSKYIGECTFEKGTHTFVLV